eukprot:229054-Rhodomonas_salina.3
MSPTRSCSASKSSYCILIVRRDLLASFPWSIYEDIGGHEDRDDAQGGIVKFVRDPQTSLDHTPCPVLA